MYDLTYNGSSASGLGIRVRQRPHIPAPERRTSRIQVPGKDGDYIIDEDAWEDIEIEVDMGFLAAPAEWAAKWRAVRPWLKGTGTLQLSDDAGYQYRVKRVVLDTAERDIKRIGRFTVLFACDPYQYLTAGASLADLPADGKLQNPLSETAHPIYKITGEGVCTLTVNGYELTANVGQNLIIDTERRLTYRVDGTLQNTAISGDYDKLQLIAGENTISVTDGFALQVQPNWRCI